MATSFNLPNNIFYNIVEKNPEFFDYYGLSPAKSMELAQARADTCLIEAATELALAHDVEIDFTDYDQFLREFAEDLTNGEIFLLANLQFQRFLFRDFSSLQARAERFTSAEQNVFSPANDRKTFIQMYETVKQQNDSLICAYFSRDRLSGKQKELSYAEDDS